MKRERTKQEVLAFILEQGNKVNISQRDIAKILGISASTVARTLQSLEEENLIVIEKTASGSLPDTIVYIGTKQIKRSLTSILNSIIVMIKDIMNSVIAKQAKVKYIEEDLPVEIDQSKVILYKHLPNADIIILKK